jgi:hypothetical protein
MSGRCRLWLVVGAAALTLTACGEASACPPRPDSPATSSPGGGLVSIETDHAIYAPGETPQVTIVNLTADPILTTPRQGYGDVCPAVRVQKLVRVEWQEVNNCFYTGGGNPSPDRGIPLARGTSPVAPPVPLDSPGTYRYVLSYGPLEPQPPSPSSAPPPTIVYSAVLQVCTCGICS